MLPTLVIGLREGLEAALIVGIIAAFLKRQGRRDLMRQMAGGVALAVVLCVGVGVGLELFSRDLPQRQQEGLETVIGVLAVLLVTYMVVWMKENSRGLKAQLEGAAAGALSGGSRAGRAMVAMAFLAVLREGFETAVFLLAAFNETSTGTSALGGAVLGLAIAVVLGYGIYRGGVRINLSRFFRATGLVLVLVAAGLVVSALHTAHEAGWLDLGQQQVLDLGWLVRPGSVVSSLLTGMLGIQPHLTLVEVAGWLLYVVPVGLFVAWPPNRTVALQRVARWLGGVALVAAAGAALLALTAPGAPAPPAATSDGTIGAQVLSLDGGHATVRVTGPWGTAGKAGTQQLTRSGHTTVAGLAADVYARTATGPGSGPDSLSPGRAARLNGGRLPLGARPDHTGRLPADYRTQRTLAVSVEPRTGRVLAARWSSTERAGVAGPAGSSLPLASPLDRSQTSLSARASEHAVEAARGDLSRLDREDTLVALAWLLAATAGIAAGGGAWARRRSRAAQATRHPAGPAPHPVNS